MLYLSALPLKKETVSSFLNSHISQRQANQGFGIYFQLWFTQTEWRGAYFVFSIFFSKKKNYLAALPVFIFLNIYLAN